MNTYIIRIYRSEGDNPRLLVGVVEEVGVEGKKAFNDIDELWTILNRKGKKETQLKTGMGNGIYENRQTDP